MQKTMLCAVIALAAAAAEDQPRKVPGFNLSYRLPAGWRPVRRIGHVELLGSATHRGVILVAPGLYATPEGALPDLLRGLEAMQLRARPTGQPERRRIAGMAGLSLSFQAYNRLRQPLQGRFLCARSGHDTALTVLALGPHQGFGPLSNAADRLIGSLRAGKPAVNQRAIAALAGRWIHHAGRQDRLRLGSGGSGHSYTEQLTFDGRGKFGFRGDSAIHATGRLGGSMNRTSSSSDQGGYSVLGPYLVLRGRKGTQVLPLRLLGSGFYVGAKLYTR